MKNIIVICLVIISLAFTEKAKAQGPNGNDFGIGIILGDPTGFTFKYWMSRNNALAGSIGTSYYGAWRIGMDYLWHLWVFNSQVVFLHAGLGGVVGISEGRRWLWYTSDGKRFYIRKSNEIGLAARGIFGLDIVPKRTPLEIFVELGVLVGLVPGFGSAVETALGFRFYP